MEHYAGIDVSLEQSSVGVVDASGRVVREAKVASEPEALVGRKLLQSKLRDVELSIRGILRGSGLKVGEVSKGRFAARIEELISGHAMLEAVIGAMLTARAGLQAEFMRLHRQMLAIVRGDAVCRRLMTVPGVGALVAVTVRTAVDDPARFGSSKAVGHGGGQATRPEAGEGGTGAQAGQCPAPHVGGRHGVLLGQGGAGRRVGRPEEVAVSGRTGQSSPARPRSRRWDAGAGEAGSSAVGALCGGARILDWPAGACLTAWCGGRVPTTDGSMTPATRHSLEELDATRPITEALQTYGAGGES